MIGRALLFSRLLTIAIAGGLVVPGVAAAQSGTAEPQNIIIFLADDMDWADLPFFSTSPPMWHDQNNPVSNLQKPLEVPTGQSASPQVQAIREARLRRPDLNRLAARVLSEPAGGTQTKLGRPHATPATDPLVVPIDLDAAGNTTAAAFRYQIDSAGCLDTTKDVTKNPACNISRDVLSGAGGLGTLARQGVVMPRFYSTSALCGPARTAFLSGRYQHRAEVANNGNALNGTRTITFAELLKQGCASPNDDVPCYHTGLFGKWDPGDQFGRNQTWNQGFDEYVGFEGHGREYFDGRHLLCSPVLDHAIDPVHPLPMSYCRDPDPNTACQTNADCPCSPFESGPGCAPTICDKISNVCYDPTPTRRCASDADCCIGSSCTSKCRPPARYVGRKNRPACQPASNDIQCCFSPEDRKNPDKPLQFERNKPRKIWLSSAVRSIEFAGGNACNDDRSYGREGLTATGSSLQVCGYSERQYRDFARDFLIRRLYDPVSDRFLLVLPLHAVHSDLQAPTRTSAHYGTLNDVNPVNPSDGRTYWAIVEEVDALVGTVVGLLDGMCDATSPEDLIGATCSPTNQQACGGHPERCRVLRDETMVLFTNDQGSPALGYGVPVLRGGKEQTLEGGSRSGLIARAPALGVGGIAGEPGAARADTTSPALGSLVDILPTVAEAAGYPVNDQGGIDLRVCGNTDTLCTGQTCAGHCVTARCTIGDKSCQTNGDCVGMGTCQAIGNRRCKIDNANCTTNADCTLPCNPYHVDGRSLLPVLSGKNPDGSDVGEQPDRIHDAVFAHLAAAGEPGLAVMTRDGYYADVCDTEFPFGTVTEDEQAACGYASHICTYRDAPPVIPGGRHLLREHSASSCTACTEDSQCENVRCEVVGKVCLSTDLEYKNCKHTGATAGGPVLLKTAAQCDVERRARCTSDAECPPEETCVDVGIECESCTAAAWKGRRGSADVPVAELFDLASNPEEDPKDFGANKGTTGETDPTKYGPDGRLNCALPSSSANARLNSIASDLSDRAGSWLACVSDQGESGADCTGEWH